MHHNSRGCTCSTSAKVLILVAESEPLKYTLWFCLLFCVTPKPNKQNQVVKVQPLGLVLVLLQEPKPEPLDECCLYDLF